MKIQCDVCGQQEASFFCCADEAALCDACDRRVHRANKLASKHRRFSLLRHPTLSPLCDICQEKRAFLFCQEDRAILCRDCDGPIHAANEHTRKHSRFLLTGVKLSPAAVPAAAAGTAPAASSSAASAETPEPARSPKAREKEGERSTISDYLIKTLPGWHVEDLLVDAPSPAASSVDILSKMGFGDDLLPFMESDRPAWQVPQVGAGFQLYPDGGSGGVNGGGMEMGFGAGGQQWWGGEDVFAVPQIIMSQQRNLSNKRQRGGA